MDITVREAAKRLGVTPGRIRQLIVEGRIVARYLNPRMAMIDEKQLAKLANRKVGRPTTKAKKQKKAR